MFKKSYCFFVCVFLFLFLGCGKKESTKKLAQSYYKLALLEIENGHNQQCYKKALDYVDKAILQDPRSEYLALKGTFLLKLNKEQESELYFQKALDNNPDPKVKSDILNNKACLFAQVGITNRDDSKIEYALNIWSELELDKDYLTPEVAAFNQSKVYIYKKDYQNATNLLHRAINISPNYLDAHFYLACAAYEVKDFSLAKKEVSTVLYLEPDHQGARELGDLLQK